MDLHVAAMSVVALANPEAARAITSLVKESIAPLLEAMAPDFGHDAPGGGFRGMSEGAMSFPVRPGAFNSENLNGTILVRITLDPPISGSGEELAGTATTATFECGYYFKTPLRKGKGEYMFPVPAGSAGITFDEDGTPGFDDAGDLADLVEAIEAVTERVVDDPPEGAKSLTRDPEERRRVREQNEAARRLQMEREREQEQQRKYQEQREADEAVYGSPEAFGRYLADQEEPDFGPADLQKVLQTMFRDKAQQGMQQVRIKDELEKLGYRFNPRKNRLSFSLRSAAGRVAEA